ncbi:unnamed protein product [Closterium sp. NIES-53]
MVEQILTWFCFPFSKVQLTPLDVDRGLPTPPSDEPFESSGPYHELVSCLICEAEIYAGAMVAQELRLLTSLLSDLNEQPRSPLANTTVFFTKALGSGDHQRFCTALGLVPTQPHLLVS